MTPARKLALEWAREFACSCGDEGCESNNVWLTIEAALTAPELPADVWAEIARVFRSSTAHEGADRSWHRSIAAYIREAQYGIEIREV